MRDDDESLRFMLSGGRLSGADHDAILERVVPRVRPRHRLAWLGAGGAVLAAGALTLFILVVHPDSRDAARPWLAAKGAASAVGLRANCADRASGVCKRGEALLFEVDGAVSGGWLAAYADSPSGERIWYFPTATGHLAVVPPNAGYFLVKEVARLGVEHSPGTHQAHLYLLDAAADRAALVEGRASVRAEAVVSFEVAP